MLHRALFLAALLSLGFGAAAAQDSAPNRSGFTLLLNVGAGFQHDEFFGETKTGVGGINLGLGGFLQDDLALMFRVSGTTVTYGTSSQSSGTVGATLQYWATADFHLEAGAGAGIWAIDDESEAGPGAILGVGYSVWNNAGHNLYIGAEYAPAFTSSGTVHNIGILFGWQLL